MRLQEIADRAYDAFATQDEAALRREQTLAEEQITVLAKVLDLGPAELEALAPVGKPDEPDEPDGEAFRGREASAYAQEQGARIQQDLKR